MRDFVFRDGAEECVLPVTPQSFDITDGINIQTVNITNAGDAIFGGNSILKGFQLSSFFPAQRYDFSKTDTEPYSFVNWFMYRSLNRRVLRFIVTNTPINIAVMIGSINYGEKDGTGDVYYTLDIERYKQLFITGTAEDYGVPRGDDAAERTEVTEYTVLEGDELWIIALREYGDASLYERLQRYNGKTSCFLTAGEKIMIPPKGYLS